MRIALRVFLGVSLEDAMLKACPSLTNLEIRNHRSPERALDFFRGVWFSLNFS